MFGFGKNKEPFKLENITSGYGMNCAKLKSIRIAQGYEVVSDRYSLQVTISCSDIKKVTATNSFNNNGTSSQCEITFWNKSDLDYFESMIERYSHKKKYSFNKVGYEGWKLPSGDFIMGFFMGGSSNMFSAKVYPSEQVEEW